MRPFAEGPLGSALKYILAEKIFTQWAVKKGGERGVVGADQPVFPDRNAAIAVGINMAVNGPRDTATSLENPGLVARVLPFDLDPDVERYQRPGRADGVEALGDEKGAGDAYPGAIAGRRQPWLVEGDRRPHLVKSQSGGPQFSFRLLVRPRP